MISKILRHFLIFVITGLRPLLGPASCKYPIGCTQYAVEQLEQEKLRQALWNIIKRLLACSPFNFKG